VRAGWCHMPSGRTCGRPSRQVPTMASVSEQRAGQPPAPAGGRAAALRLGFYPSCCCPAAAARSGPKKIRQVKTENSKRSLPACPDSSSSHSNLSDSLSENLVLLRVATTRSTRMHFISCTVRICRRVCTVLLYSRNSDRLPFMTREYEYTCTRIQLHTSWLSDGAIEIEQEQAGISVYVGTSARGCVIRPAARAHSTDLRSRNFYYSLNIIISSS